MIALLLLLAGCGDAPSSAPAEAAVAQAELYTCGMHPEVVQEGPGSCPLCGMDLTPMSAKPASTTVDVPSGFQQVVGVRTEVVSRGELSRSVRTVGEIEVPEDALTVLSSRVSGVVEKLYVSRTGDPVSRGAAVLELYSPELVVAQEELVRAGPDSPWVKVAIDKLERYDIAKRDIERVAAGGVRNSLPLRAPASGIVVDKMVDLGSSVKRGDALVRIADLSTVWVMAEVYALDAPWVSAGQTARVQVDGLERAATVDRVYPTLTPSSRTTKLRLVLDNADQAVRPGAFATVYVDTQTRADVLTVPAEAVLRSGMRNVVFVALGEGRFEPREVVLGLEGDGDRIEVRSGVEAGEAVVASGQFLLDAESQLQEALNKLLASPGGVDPHAGHDHGSPASTAPEPQAGHDHGPHGSGEVLGYACKDHPKELGAEGEACGTCGEPLLPFRDYWCPMHPEVHATEPGVACDKCGGMILYPHAQAPE